MCTVETLIDASFLNRVCYEIVRSFEDGDINANRRRLLMYCAKDPTSGTKETDYVAAGKLDTEKSR